MTNSERVTYWDSKPELKLHNEFGVLDRRVLIKHVAELMNKPRVLEIGVNEGHVLEYCNEAFGSYVGVDVDLSLKRLPPRLPYPPFFFEGSSFAFWRELNCVVEYDLIFVDGDHHTFEAYVDITQALLRLAPNGYVLAHDVSVSDGLKEGEDYDASPRFAHNRIKNLPGWYARILEGHPEGLAIYFRTD